MFEALRRRGIRMLVVATAILAGATGIALATIPGSDGVIAGCYEKRTGLLRVIDAEAGKKCFSFETPISWSQRGPKGDAGVAGPIGPRGERGPAGPAATVIRVGPLEQGVSLAHCLIGEVATGGGGVATGAAPALSHSLPLNGEAGTTPTGWIARTSNPDGFVRAYAVCAGGAA
jgi:hypothetical protein